MIPIELAMGTNGRSVFIQTNKTRYMYSYYCSYDHKILHWSYSYRLSYPCGSFKEED